MPTPVPPLADLEDASAALNRVRSAIEAVDDTKLSRVNTGVTAAVARGLAAAAALVEYRDRIQALPEFDMSHLDCLEDYAKAVWYLNVTDFEPKTPESPAPLIKEMQALRAKLLTWARPLAEFGFFAQASVDKIKDGAGHKDAAGDLVALANLYERHWAEVKDNCGVTQEEVAHAAQLGTVVFRVLSERQFAHKTPSDAEIFRAKAWTLFEAAYAQCRRAVAYLRFAERDVDQIVPNLRRNKGPKGRRRGKPLPNP